ncbi:protein SCO1 homolog 2, mitochondrial isoform X2 [Populus trichocarpa]|uniref:protein SCO1 homolog 2, mitochondrial isoform X2 n=1 Tax=Populus trichocarpa TaxID=3694 RepID=UPI002277B706|nr:protein SCO1 homolog 2, mitochondrial isoform X2 [Populus trichocarpa]
MPISRFLSFSSKYRPRQALNLLERLGPSKRVQSSNLSKSTRQNNGKLDVRLVEQVQVEPRVPRSYAIPAAILGFAGLAAFVHYNDERRAVPKESKANLKVLPVFVTLDPQRDNPSHLRAYLKEFEPRIVGLTGSVGAIRQMAQEYRVYFRKIEEEGEDYLVESSHDMYFINPNMEVVRCFGVEYNAEELSEAIQKELKRTSA